jgi:hypothetical protein
VRIDRATASAPPADLMWVDLIQSRRPSRRKGGSGAGQGAGSGTAQGLGRAAERGHGQRQGGWPAGKKNRGGVGHWEKEERGKETLARGAQLPERKERGRARRTSGELVPTSGPGVAAREREEVRGMAGLGRSGPGRGPRGRERGEEGPRGKKKKGER